MSPGPQSKIPGPPPRERVSDQFRLCRRADADSRLLPLLRSRTFLLLQARGTAAGVGYTVYLATVLWLSFRLQRGSSSRDRCRRETAVYSLTFLVGPLVDRIVDKRWVYVVCYPIQPWRPSLSA